MFATKCVLTFKFFLLANQHLVDFMPSFGYFLDQFGNYQFILQLNNLM